MLSDLIPFPGFKHCLSGDDFQNYMCSSDLSLELQTHLYRPNADLTVPLGCLIVLANAAHPKHNPWLPSPFSRLPHLSGWQCPAQAKNISFLISHLLLSSTSSLLAMLPQIHLLLFISTSIAAVQGTSSLVWTGAMASKLVFLLPFSPRCHSFSKQLPESSFKNLSHVSFIPLFKTLRRVHVLLESNSKSSPRLSSHDIIWPPRCLLAFSLLSVLHCFCFSSVPSSGSLSSLFPLPLTLFLVLHILTQMSKWLFLPTLRSVTHTHPQHWLSISFIWLTTIYLSKRAELLTVTLPAVSPGPSV